MLNLATTASSRVIHQSVMATMNILAGTSVYKQFIYVNHWTKLSKNGTKNQLYYHVTSQVPNQQQSLKLKEQGCDNVLPGKDYCTAQVSDGQV